MPENYTNLFLDSKSLNLEQKRHENWRNSNIKRKGF